MQPSVYILHRGHAPGNKNEGTDSRGDIDTLNI